MVDMWNEGLPWWDRWGIGLVVGVTGALIITSVDLCVEKSEQRIIERIEQCQCVEVCNE